MCLISWSNTWLKGESVIIQKRLSICNWLPLNRIVDGAGIYCKAPPVTLQVLCLLCHVMLNGRDIKMGIKWFIFMYGTFMINMDRYKPITNWNPVHKIIEIATEGQPLHQVKFMRFCMPSIVIMFISSIERKAALQIIISWPITKRTVERKVWDWLNLVKLALHKHSKCHQISLAI